MTPSCCHWCPQSDICLKAGLLSLPLNSQQFFLPLWKIPFPIYFRFAHQQHISDAKNEANFWLPLSFLVKSLTTGSGPCIWGKSKRLLLTPEGPCPTQAPLCLQQRRDYRSWGCNILLPDTSEKALLLVLVRPQGIW